MRFLKNTTLLLGVSMALSIASPARSADLGVMTGLDVCDASGFSGLTISSETNCLVITGEVEYTFIWGDYDADREVVNDLEFSGGYDVFVGDAAVDWESKVETWIQFAGTASSDFGPAKAVIRIEGTNEVVYEDGALDDETDEVVLDRAYVSIGDTTVLTAGKTSTIANLSHDTALTYQEMFNEDEASGVGYNSDLTDTSIGTAGMVIQVESYLGNGFTVGAGLEDLDDEGTLIGVVEYDSKNFDAHVTVLGSEVLTGTMQDWAVHAGADLKIENFQVRGALAFNNDGWWNILGTAKAEFDIFTLAVAAEATSADEYGLAVSGAAEVTEGVTINLASRAFREADDELTVDTMGEFEAELAEHIVLIAGGGYIYESDSADGLTYGRVTLEWTPDGDFETELTGRVHSRPGNDLGYEVTFVAKKAFE